MGPWSAYQTARSAAKAPTPTAPSPSLATPRLWPWRSTSSTWGEYPCRSLPALASGCQVKRSAAAKPFSSIALCYCSSLFLSLSLLTSPRCWRFIWSEPLSLSSFCRDLSRRSFCLESAVSLGPTSPLPLPCLAPTSPAHTKTSLPAAPLRPPPAAAYSQPPPGTLLLIHFLELVLWRPRFIVWATPFKFKNRTRGNWARSEMEIKLAILHISSQPSERLLAASPLSSSSYKSLSKKRMHSCVLLYIYLL